MKKIILAIALFAAVGANAQSDGFFTYNIGEGNRTENSWGTMPNLPASHGFGDDYNANAPLGSGLLLLGGMAVLYASRKRKFIRHCPLSVKKCVTKQWLALCR